MEQKHQRARHVRAYRAATFRSAVRTATRALIFSAGLFAGCVLAQNTYPDKPIRVIVPYAPGGGTDVSARTLSDQLRSLLGQSFVVDNRVGGSGRIGTATVVKAAPDGYTLLVTTASTTSVLFSVDPSLSYDPRKDLAPVAIVADIPMFAVVESSIPAKSIAELIAYAKANEGKLNYGSGGSGTISHLVAELFLLESALKMTHIPYKGETDRLRALLGKEIQFAFVATATLYSKSNRVRILATTSPTPWPTLPEVQTFTSMGLKRVEFMAWTALFAPAQTPVEIIARLNASVNRAVRSEKFRFVMSEAGFRPKGGTPEELAEALRREIELFTETVHKAGIKPN